MLPVVRKPSMLMVLPLPLCWNTLSLAWAAEPPRTRMILPLPPFMVAASSQTSCQTTLLRLQLPSQCTPSAAFLLMTTFCSVAPSFSRKTGCWLSEEPLHEVP